MSEPYPLPRTPAVVPAALMRRLSSCGSSPWALSSATMSVLTDLRRPAPIAGTLDERLLTLYVQTLLHWARNRGNRDNDAGARVRERQCGQRRRHGQGAGGYAVR